MCLKRNLLYSLAVLSCLPGAVFAQGDDFLNDGTWTISADAIFLDRTPGNRKTLAVDTSLPTPKPRDNVVLDTDDLVDGFDYEPGYRLSSTIVVTDTGSLEVSYLQIFKWKESKSVISAGGTLQFPFEAPQNTQDYYMANMCKASYRTNFSTGELNYWEAITPRHGNYFSFSMLFGARYAHISENLKTTYTKQGRTSDYKISTRNNLFGGQLGGDLQWNPTRQLSWDFFAIVGGYVNLCEQDTLLKDNNNSVVLQSVDANKTKASFIFEGGLAASYQVVHNLNFHGGYEVFYLAGIATAPDQIDTSKQTATSNRVQANDGFFIHGFWIGLSVGF